MDSFESAAPAQKQTTMRQAVCWDCGLETECFEYVVCCTGTLFHLCPACEAKGDEEDDDTTETPGDSARARGPE